VTGMILGYFFCRNIEKLGFFFWNLNLTLLKFFNPWGAFFYVAWIIQNWAVSHIVITFLGMNYSSDSEIKNFTTHQPLHTLKIPGVSINFKKF
jgi:hypothetical protein